MINQKINVLLIDDDEDFSRLTAFRLKQFNCHVDYEANAIDVLDQIKRNPPDLIILDMLMPGVLGSTLCQSIKSDSELKHIIVVVSSGLPIESDDRFKKSKADYYFEKNDAIFDKLIKVVSAIR